MSHPESSSNANSIKDIIASNLNLLAKLYGKTRKEVCADLNLSYTTYCDWVNARTYPRMEAIDQLCNYFRINISVFFSNLDDQPLVIEKLSSYAANYGVALSDDGTPRFAPSQTTDIPKEYPVELIQGKYYTYEAPASIHQHIVAELCLFIGHFIKKNHTGHRLYPGPFSVEFPTESDTIVVPDISIIHDFSSLDSYGYVGVPDWIIEITSPSTRTRDQVVKRDIYEACRVLEYWVIDPYRLDVTVYTLVTGFESHYRVRTYAYSETIASSSILGLTLRMVDLDILS